MLMMKPYLLRLHRWPSLLFALPLVAVILTGLVLSFEPIVQFASVRPGAITLANVEGILAKADPGNQASAISINAAEDSLTLGGGPGSPGRSYSLSTGEQVAAGRWASFFNLSRGIHERLIGDLGWLVTASTMAMLVIAGFGIFMGLPRLRNTMAGWHKGTAWILLPLVILSPLTGLALAFNVTFTTAPAAGPRGPQASLLQAVRFVADGHDLSALNSIRRRGPTLMARIWEGGKLTNYAVTGTGLTPMQANWPRLIHEGNGFGIWGGLVNVVTSLALIGLLGTGVWMWARRSLRRRVRVRVTA